MPPLRGLLVALVVLPAVARAQGTNFDGWRLMPVRSQGEFERGELGGRAEQYMQGGTRCDADPNVIYLSHDCSLPWRSIDGGRTWEKPLGIGLYVSMGQSIAVDPVNCQHLLLIVDNSYDYKHPGDAGIYLSEDGGDHWRHVLTGPTLNSRRYEHNLAWARDSVDAQGARRWYAALYNETTEPNNANAALHVSTDRGQTWTAGASLAGRDPVYEVQVSPTNGQDVLVATSTGLLRSTDGGMTLLPVAGLPGGSVSSVAFHPTDPRTVLAVALGGTPRGVYRSIDGGTSFTRLSATDSGQQAVLDQAIRLAVHPRDGQVFYVLPQADGQALRTGDGGSSFAATSFDLPVDIRAWRWGVQIGGSFGFVLPSALDTHDAVAQSLGAAMYRTSDGLVFANASTLFEGANCGLTNYGVAFDPAQPARFALATADIGMLLTENGADYFVDRGTPYEWRGDIAAWSSQHTLDFRPGSPGEMASVVGDVFDKILAFTPDYGQSWEVANTVSNHSWRVAYHPQKSNIVWAGDKRSTDGGRTYARLPFPAALDASDLQVLSFCNAQPDTVYAVARSSGNILRSDDAGDSWRLYTTAPGSVTPFDPIYTFASDPTQCGVVYSLGLDGDLARYDGTSWQGLGVLDHVAAPAGYFRYVRSVQVDTQHPEVIYAGIFGTGLETVILRSTDRGGTWQNISYNRFREGVSGINVSPHSGEVFVGGCSGTWVLPPPYQSTDGIYPKLVSRPSCYDGLQNGEETQVDCGGSRCAACGGAAGGGASNAGAANGGVPNGGASLGGVSVGGYASANVGTGGSRAGGVGLGGGLPPDGRTDDGCSCHISRTNPGTALWLVGVALGAMVIRRRRSLRARELVCCQHETRSVGAWGFQHGRLRGRLEHRLLSGSQPAGRRSVIRSKGRADLPLLIPGSELIGSTDP